MVDSLRGLQHPGTLDKVRKNFGVGPASLELAFGGSGGLRSRAGSTQFSLWNAIVAKGSSSSCHIRDNSSYDVERAMELTDADRAAGVVSDEVVVFGRSKRQTTPDHPVRIVPVKATPHSMLRSRSEGAS